MSQAFSVQSTAQHLLIWEAEHAGEDLDLSEAANRVCTRLCHQFGRLVGDSGCDLLMTRALTRAAVEHSLLRGVRWQCGATGSFVGLSERLAEQDPEVVRTALTAAIAAFLSLLSRFIGEDLTRRQLDRAWPELLPGHPATEAGD